LSEVSIDLVDLRLSISSVLHCEPLGMQELDNISGVSRVLPSASLGPGSSLHTKYNCEELF